MSEFNYYVKKPIHIKAKILEEDTTIHTMEGKMEGKKGDYMVVGIHNEKYVVNKDIFEESYVRVIK